MEILVPIVRHASAKRLVLAGDHLQLPAFAMTDEGRNKASNCLFERAHASKKVPSIMLQEQYRSHSLIASGPYQIVYKGDVIPYWDFDAKPREFLVQLEATYPIEFSVGQDTYFFGSCLAFIDVPGGREVGPYQGTRQNDREGMNHELSIQFYTDVRKVAVVIALTLALVKKGIAMHRITIQTGYKYAHSLSLTLLPRLITLSLGRK